MDHPYHLVCYNQKKVTRTQNSAACVQSVPGADNYQCFDVVYALVFKEYWLERSSVRHGSQAVILQSASEMS